MCKCNPMIRTMYCGRGDCIDPKDIERKNLKIFEIDNSFWVLTTTIKKAIEICIDREVIDKDCIGEIEIKECNYQDKTWQSIDVLKNIFSIPEINEIKEILNNYTDEVHRIREKTTYHFKDCKQYGYIGVHLTFEQIINNHKILCEFETNEIISTTEV